MCVVWEYIVWWVGEARDAIGRAEGKSNVATCPGEPRETGWNIRWSERMDEMMNDASCICSPGRESHAKQIDAFGCKLSLNHLYPSTMTLTPGTEAKWYDYDEKECTYVSYSTHYKGNGASRLALWGSEG